MSSTTSNSFVAPVDFPDIMHDCRGPRSQSRASGSSSLFPSDFLNNEAFDMNSDAEHASTDSSVPGSYEPYHLLLPHELRTPAQPLSPPEDHHHPATDSPLCSTFFPAEGALSRPWVAEVGAAKDQGIRSSMEDEHITLVEPDVCFFGLYDGHGGRQCAEFVRSRLHEVTLAHPMLKTAPHRAISDAFAQVEREFLQQSSEEASSSGCVCAAAVIQNGTLTVGNVGDCEVVLARGGRPVLLTVKHNPSCNDAEASRVKEAGGCIINRRVGHPRLNPRLCSLAVSRAVGDAGFKLERYTDGKASGLIAVADTAEVTLTREDAFVLIACDGLWDTMSYADAVELAAEYLATGADADKVADQLVCEALRRGTRDNVTVIFVRLSAPPAAAEHPNG